MALTAGIALVVAAGAVNTINEYNATSAAKDEAERNQEISLRNAEIIRAAGERDRKMKEREYNERARVLNLEQQAEAARMRLTMSGGGMSGGTQFELLSNMATRHEMNLGNLDYNSKAEQAAIINNARTQSYQQQIMAWQYGNQASYLASSRNSQMFGNILDTGASAFSVYAMGSTGGPSNFSGNMTPSGQGYANWSQARNNAGIGRVGYGR
jgi:hypothetical protein